MKEKTINILNISIYNFTKIIILLLFITLEIIKNDNNIVSNFKSIYLSENEYYIITFENIYFYTITEISVNLKVVRTFTSDEKISTEEEIEKINLGKFNDNDSFDTILLIIQNYVYALKYNLYYCHTQLKEIEGYFSQIFPFKCVNLKCYYVVGIINSSKQLLLYLYKNPSYECDSNLAYTFSINDVGSDTFSCQIMQSLSNGKVLTCFYQNNNAKEIIASSLNIDVTKEKIEAISSLKKSKTNNGATIIKSILSQDGTKSYVCYINDNNNCDCLTYNITTNEWSDYSTYINGCLSKPTSLLFDYYDISNEYFLYCYQSSSKINILKLDENFKAISQYVNDTFDSVKKCSKYFLSSLRYHTSNIILLETCDNILNDIYLGEFLNNQLSIPISELEFTTSLYTTIPSTTTSSTLFISDTYSINNSSKLLNPLSIIIIQKNSNKAKEEIIVNMGDIIDECDLGKIYEIFGNDYEIKISPINIKKYKNISTYIDFLSCEEKLRNYYHISNNSILTVFQIEINKNNEKSLTNQVEYAVFDEKKDKLDLSICSDEQIKIYHSVNNYSVLNISSISTYADIGVDIFNINEEFFNDICYPYSEENSDIILRDRVSDIYQNYSLCDSNCEYENIDIENMTITCNCLVKTEIETEIEEPKYNQMIFDIFQDSTIGVIKCYNLVFNLNKKNNIGFWIFLIFIITHIPFIIHYLIKGDIQIIKYIKNQLIKLHYLPKIGNPKKKAVIKNLNNKGRVNFNLYNIFNLNDKKIRKRKIGTSTINELLGDNSSSIRKIYNFNNKINNILKIKNDSIALKNDRKKNYKKKTTKKMNNKNKNNNKYIINNKKKYNNKLSINNKIINKKSKHKTTKKREKKIFNIKYYYNSYFILHKNKKFHTLRNYRHNIHFKVLKLNNEYINKTFPQLYMNRKYTINKSCCSFLYKLFKHTNYINKDSVFKYNLYYDRYEDAIKYENRNLCKIFLIFLVIKEKIINFLNY